LGLPLLLQYLLCNFLELLAIFEVNHEDVEVYLGKKALVTVDEYLQHLGELFAGTERLMLLKFRTILRSALDSLLHVGVLGQPVTPIFEVVGDLSDLCHVPLLDIPPVFDLLEEERTFLVFLLDLRQQHGFFVAVLGCSTQQTQHFE
jgi:hypothetical protein